MEKEKVEKWYQSKALLIIVSVVMSSVLFMQNLSIQQNQTRIDHRLNTKDVYFQKRLIDGAKEREKAYLDMRHWGERVLNHCLTAKCELPNDLTLLPPSKQFDSLESILTRSKE